MLRIFTKKTNKLSKNEIIGICKLKDTHWKYGLKSQSTWFYKNVKKSAYNNMMFFNNKLIGYTLIRINNYEKNQKRKKLLLIDTVIIKKNFQRKGFGKMLHIYNNIVIKKIGLDAILICKKKLVEFYKKLKWSKANKSLYAIKKNIDNNVVILKFNKM
jgi:hypothetical protein